MNIRLFNKKYWVRQFDESQTVIKGYAVNAYADKVFSLNVHPAGADTLSALPEGERINKRLEAHGDPGITPSDIENGKKGDLLYYHGDWYECVSASLWDHTALSHVNYQFSLIPKDTNATDVKDPPKSDPEYYQEIKLLEETYKFLTDEKNRLLFFVRE